MVIFGLVSMVFDEHCLAMLLGCRGLARPNSAAAGLWTRCCGPRAAGRDRAASLRALS
jgi:hypothetical protein